MQALTSILRRHWEWQEDRRCAWVPGFFRYKTAFLASLDVKTAFDVAKPAVISKALTNMETHGHVMTPLLEDMKDVQVSVCFEK